MMLHNFAPPKRGVSQHERGGVGMLLPFHFTWQTCCFFQQNSLIHPDRKSVFWDNKKGVQVPTHLIRDSLFVQCETVIDKKVFKSNFFIIHIAGEGLGKCRGTACSPLV